MFQAGTLGYFGEFIALSHVAGISQKARHSLPLGYGTFGYEPNVQRLFGLPRAITPGGISVNVRLGRIIFSLDGDSSKFRDLNLQSGLLSSALENGVPEQMFSTPTQRADGISAVKALQIASSQGQRIYHITSQNQAQVLPNLRLDGLAMTEITTALATGKEVIAHTDRISVPGWTGEGYILFDPVTGDGAYKITGGSNGGFITGLLAGPALFASVTAAVISLFAGAWLIFLVAIIAVLAWLYVIAESQLSAAASCFNAGLIIGPFIFGELAMEVTPVIGALLMINDAVSALSVLGSALECRFN
jgi:hypothetical protein